MFHLSFFILLTFCFSIYIKKNLKYNTKSKDIMVRILDMRVDSISDPDLDTSGFIITPSDFGCYLNPVRVEPNADYTDSCESELFCHPIYSYKFKYV